jgi:hypothetical protein
MLVRPVLLLLLLLLATLTSARSSAMLPEPCFVN